MVTKLRVFVSSKMTEFEQERDQLYKIIPELLTGLITLEPWVYEKSVKDASHAHVQQTYLGALAKSKLYIGLVRNL